jgi:hypothetical protein
VEISIPLIRDPKSQSNDKSKGWNYHIRAYLSFIQQVKKKKKKNKKKKKKICNCNITPYGWVDIGSGFKDLKLA